MMFNASNPDPSRVADSTADYDTHSRWQQARTAIVRLSREMLLCRNLDVMAMMQAEMAGLHLAEQAAADALRALLSTQAVR